MRAMCEESAELHLVHTLHAHCGEVACADASGALLATGGGEGALRLWRWQRGAGWLEAGGEARAHRFSVTVARWAPSGALLATAGVDGAAKIWTRDLAARHVLTAPGAAAARALCWAGARLLVGHDDGALCAWAVRRGTLLARLQLCEGALHAVAALPSAALLLVACTTGTLKIFDLGDVYVCGVSGGEPPTPLLWEDGAHDLGALCAAASTCGRVVASGGHDARVRLWRVGYGAGEARASAFGVLRGHAAAVTALAWARGTQLLGSASLDRTARLWAYNTLTCLRVLDAHSRYLTCITLPANFRYLLTGSNDRTVRTWSVGGLGLDDDMESPCSILSHFGLGDLEGIEPIFDDEPYEETCAGAGAEKTAGSEPEMLWVSDETHVGAINSIATYKDLLVTACSDGRVRVFRWSEGRGALTCEHTLPAHRYSAAAVDLGVGDTLLLSAGLDGRARLWDVQSGCELLSLTCEGVCGGGRGGGGVRGARLSPHRPPLLLLATDDGALALWTIQRPHTEPIHIYEPFTEAATCCAWSCEGRIIAAGSAGGEMRVLAAPPAAITVHAQRDAHDLGVLCLDFAPKENMDESKYIIASAGHDTLVKIWEIELNEVSYGEARATVRLLHRVEAHGGAVEDVRWGACGTRLLTCGADGWARMWRLASDIGAQLVATVPAGGTGDSGANGATAAAMLSTSLFAVGSLTGQLAVWRIPPAPELRPGDDEEDEELEPRLWGVAGVVRWLREYVTRVPGSLLSSEVKGAVEARARAAGLCGARLLDEPLHDLLQLLRPEKQHKIEENSKFITEFEERRDLEHLEENEQFLKQLRDEIEWLRREPPAPELEARAPHALRCPLTHALLREPVRAADGFSYERANILDYFFASDGAVSPLTGRRLRSARLEPNLALRRQLRDFLREQPRPDPTSPVDHLIFV